MTAELRQQIQHLTKPFLLCIFRTSYMPVIIRKPWKKTAVHSMYTACNILRLETVQFCKSPYGLNSQVPGEFCGIALYPLFSYSVQPPAAHAAAISSSQRNNFILLGETLNENFKEIVIYHFEDIEHQSGGEKHACCRHHDEEVFGFQHFCLPVLSWQCSSKSCNRT